ncbi:hypothetical protein ABEF93_002654 [Exophiala dermatitidis]
MASKSPNWLARLVRSDKSQRDSTPKIAEDEAGTDPRARRREQVRRAQRTHRDRRATYLKTLEAEVARLRSLDAAHTAEIQSYRRTIRRLKELCSDYGIPLPSDLALDPDVSTPQATIELVGLSDRSQSIRAEMPEEYELSASDARSALFWPSGSTTVNSGAMPVTTNTNSTRLNNSSIPAASAAVRHPDGLDSIQVGIDFVLALEQACLTHHTQHACNDDGNGHTMMLTNPIMELSPSPTQTKQTETGIPNGTRWTVPAIELEKLLELSNQLNLSGEITPVEAWQRIRQHPNFVRVTREGLEAMKLALVPEIQCHGFGAVIDEAYFDQILQQFLGYHAVAS